MSGTVFDALSGCAVRSMWFLCGEAQGGVVPSLLHWPERNSNGRKETRCDVWPLACGTLNLVKPSESVKRYLFIMRMRRWHGMRHEI